MKDNEKENIISSADGNKKKKGFLPWLRLGRSSAVEASSVKSGGQGLAGLLAKGAGAGRGGAGLFAKGFGSLLTSRAGIMGMLLGLSALAVGIGLVYNFAGGPGSSAYGPGLFQNSYYQDAISDAVAQNPFSDGEGVKEGSYFDQNSAVDNAVSGDAGEGDVGTGEEAISKDAGNLADKVGEKNAAPALAPMSGLGSGSSGGGSSSSGSSGVTAGKNGKSSAMGKNAKVTEQAGRGVSSAQGSDSQLSKVYKTFGAMGSVASAQGLRTLGDNAYDNAGSAGNILSPTASTGDGTEPTGSGINPSAGSTESNLPGQGPGDVPGFDKCDPDNVLDIDKDGCCEDNDNKYEYCPPPPPPWKKALNNFLLAIYALCAIGVAGSLIGLSKWVMGIVAAGTAAFALFSLLPKVMDAGFPEDQKWKLYAVLGVATAFALAGNFVNAIRDMGIIVKLALGAGVGLLSKMFLEKPGKDWQKEQTSQKINNTYDELNDTTKE